MINECPKCDSQLSVGYEDYEMGYCPKCNRYYKSKFLFKEC